MQNIGIRSRQGCLTCRRRHKKCDEERPICQLCHRTGRKCEYGSGIRWASSTSLNASPTAKTKRNGRRAPSRHPYQSAFSIQPRSASNNSGSLATNEASLGALDTTSWDGSFGDQAIDIWANCNGSTPSWHDPMSDQDLADILELSHNTGPTIDHAGDQATPCFDGSFLDWQAAAMDSSLPHSDDEYSRNNARDNETVAVSALQKPIDCGLRPWLSTSLTSPNEELAFYYYINDASARMPAFDSPQNPYRKLCSIALSYPLLLHTILFVSTVSMVNYGKEKRDCIVNRQDQAFKLLRNASTSLEAQRTNQSLPWLEQDQSLSVLSLREVTLAAYLMHIVSEVMMGSPTTEVHLQDAFSLIVELKYIDSLPHSFYSRFLTQRFAMIDVVLSFLRRRKPLAPAHFALYQQHDDMDEQEPSFREMTGCPQPVLSFLARVSILANEPDSENHTRLADAYQLESEMRAWGALQFPRGPWCQGAQSMAIASAYRGEARTPRDRHLFILHECFFWVAHLLLTRRVFQETTASARVQMYRKHLFALMECLPPGCGPDSSLPFPFYMAAREAMSTQDRTWVRQRHTEMMSVYRDRSRELMMQLTEKIWSQSGPRNQWHDRAVSCDAPLCG